jgi:hypothetical protein
VEQAGCYFFHIISRLLPTTAGPSRMPGATAAAPSFHRLRERDAGHHRERQPTVAEIHISAQLLTEGH